MYVYVHVHINVCVCVYVRARVRCACLWRPHPLHQQTPMLPTVLVPWGTACMYRGEHVTHGMYDVPHGISCVTHGAFFKGCDMCIDTVPWVTKAYTVGNTIYIPWVYTVGNVSPTVYTWCSPRYILLPTVYIVLPTVLICHPRYFLINILMSPTVYNVTHGIKCHPRYTMSPTVLYCSPRYIRYRGEHPPCSPR